MDVEEGVAMTHLDDIRARLARGTRDVWPSDYQTAPKDLSFLLAKVDELTAQHGVRDESIESLAQSIIALTGQREAALAEVERLTGEAATERAATVAWLRIDPVIVEECCHRGCGCFPVGTLQCPMCGRSLIECEEQRPETRNEIADAIERGDHWKIVDCG
jgi:hypothetical protein